jgi:Spy/CpxP family protein refolding chaperone
MKLLFVLAVAAACAAAALSFDSLWSNHHDELVAHHGHKGKFKHKSLTLQDSLLKHQALHVRGGKKWLVICRLSGGKEI